MYSNLVSLQIKCKNWNVFLIKLLQSDPQSLEDMWKVTAYLKFVYCEPSLSIKDKVSAIKTWKNWLFKVPEDLPRIDCDFCRKKQHLHKKIHKFTFSKSYSWQKSYILHFSQKKKKKKKKKITFQKPIFHKNHIFKITFSQNSQCFKYQIQVNLRNKV